MNWPQYTVIVLCVMELGFHLGKHGEEKRDTDGNVDKYNFGYALFSCALTLWILYKGGFFK